jgi:hypothetical protein
MFTKELLLNKGNSADPVAQGSKGAKDEKEISTHRMGM